LGFAAHRPYQHDSVHPHFIEHRFDACRFAPALPLALTLLLSILSQMDVPTGSSYEAERPATASFSLVPRSLAAASSLVLARDLFVARYRACAAAHLRRF
jgi:hypothetical protein